MTQKIKMTAVALLATIGLTVIPAKVAEAGSKGRRNTAIAAGAVGIYGLATKKPLLAGAGLGVGAYSYVRSRQAAKKERNRRKLVRRTYWRNGRRYTRYVRR